MPARRKQATPSADQLLAEHQACQESAHHLESTIWATSTAIGLGLLGAFVFVVARPSNDQPSIEAACLLGPVSAGFALIWWFLARRWWSIQQALFLRMRHIEQKLGLHEVRYAKYLDDLRQGNEESLAKSGLSSAEKSDLRDRATKKLMGLFMDHQKAGVQLILLLVPLTLLVAWWTYAAILLVRYILGAA